MIPTGIQERYLQLAEKKGEGHIISGIGHGILVPKDENEQKATEQLFGLSADFLLHSLHHE